MCLPAHGARIVISCMMTPNTPVRTRSSAPSLSTPILIGWRHLFVNILTGFEVGKLSMQSHLQDPSNLEVATSAKCYPVISALTVTSHETVGVIFSFGGVPMLHCGCARSNLVGCLCSSRSLLASGKAFMTLLHLDSTPLIDGVATRVTKKSYIIYRKKRSP